MTNKYAPKLTDIRGQIIKIGNLDLYFEEYGSGKPLLLLHGFGGCAQNWQPFIGELSQSFRLIVVDLRGHGYSNNPE
jgi:pimeloyl-ACP methyl ester carboxylesterase